MWTAKLDEPCAYSAGQRPRAFAFCYLDVLQPEPDIAFEALQSAFEYMELPANKRIVGYSSRRARYFCETVSLEGRVEKEPKLLSRSARLRLSCSSPIS